MEIAKKKTFYVKFVIGLNLSSTIVATLFDVRIDVWTDGRTDETSYTVA